MTPPTDPLPMPQPESAALAHAARVLWAGGLVAYPTETVWGLAAHPDHPAALARLYAVKGRAADKAVQVSCADGPTALALAAPSAELARLSRFWPGPLTVVAPAAPDCPALLAPGGRVGLRVPAHPLALALLREVGGVLLTTSCNPSGEPPAQTYAAALAHGLADFTLPDPDPVPGGQASTVYALPERVVLRLGALPAEQLEAALSGEGP